MRKKANKGGRGKKKKYFTLLELKEKTDIEIRILRDCIRKKRWKARKMGRSYFVSEDDYKEFQETYVAVISERKNDCSSYKKCLTLSALRNSKTMPCGNCTKYNPCSVRLDDFLFLGVNPY